MSIIKYSSAGVENHKALSEIFRNSAEPTPEEVICWIRLWRLSVKINIYLAKFGNIIETLDYVTSLEHLNPVITSKSDAEKYIDEIHNIGGKVIVPTSKDYPEILAEIQDFPLALYVNGNTDLLRKRMFAIVGSRSASVDALQIAYNFARDLSEFGIAIVSGFANGIDTAACNGALKYGTVQVLGSGMKTLYPRSNTALYRKVLENNGLFISEFPPSFPAKPTNFPIRNRIITGLSHGVLIGQAGRQNGVSGTLVTLRIALHQNKQIFACPGNILDEKSKICNELIKNGTARFTTSAQDIITALEDYCSLQKHALKIKKPEDGLYHSTKTEKTKPPEIAMKSITAQIYDLLSTRPISVNEITNAAGLSVAQVQEALTELELTGQAMVNHTGKYTKSLL